MKKIKPQFILIATIVVSCYFLLLFLNINLKFIEAESAMAVFGELLTLPFILLELLIAIYCSIKIFTNLKEKQTINIISLILSLATIVSMFLVK